MRRVNALIGELDEDGDRVMDRHQLMLVLEALLDSEWEQLQEPASGRTYYCHKDTCQTTWSECGKTESDINAWLVANTGTTVAADAATGRRRLPPPLPSAVGACANVHPTNQSTNQSLHVRRTQHTPLQKAAEDVGLLAMVDR